ncbi:hypothetical protein TVAG_217330 [Trichomonas vaginalis G3]|uniref:Uncharacterized protein n=1 Tax=Trichomonas vaginalis (strain ATCC PRA-98 / G3) TaxID=412133 RepID=A2EZB5_TRIV3|nr:hypothetical protein TVAGG3_0136460 [Trichomonas vaginalis G3]EAY01996.1 hypothetical protein TVAG_217330 [Trichomonas vaginalis G3]KAI5546439.1 hypothetical protein TVAGG3_0136460 [Trichomonas vaginalis G3]|eukprot:XP_001330476.1 hypothetical protein [Trichomonas vaginalis G3]
MNDCLEIMLEIAGKIVQKQVVFEYLLSHGLINNWGMVDIWEMLQKFQNCENQFFRFEAISALTQFQKDNLYPDASKRVFDGLQYDLTLKEFENSEELQFEMNSAPNLDTLSVRGSLLKLIKQNEGDSEFNEDNSLKINGIDLIYTDDESHSFALYILAYLEYEIDDSDQEFLLSTMNPTSLVVLNMIDKELAFGIAIYQKTDDKLLNYALNFIKQNNIVDNSHDIEELFKEFEDKIPKDQIVVDTDEIDEILLKIISEIQENQDLDIEFLQKIMGVSCYFMQKYVEVNCCSNLLQIFLNSAKKMEIVPYQLISVLFNSIFEVINEKSLLEENVYYELCEICLDSKRFDINPVIFQFISAILAIIKCGYTYSYAPFLLIASILKICPELSDIVIELVSDRLPKIEDDDTGMISCWSIMFSAAIIACDGDFAFVPNKALDKWMSNVPLLKNNFVLKFASKALSVLAKETNEKKYLDTLDKILNVTPENDEDYFDYENYEFILNELLK